MESKKLEALLMAVDLGSFTKAAEVMGYTQSGLTHLVDSLERDIGLRRVSTWHPPSGNFCRPTRGWTA